MWSMTYVYQETFHIIENLSSWLITHTFFYFPLENSLYRPTLVYGVFLWISLRTPKPCVIIIVFLRSLRGASNIIGLSAPFPEDTSLRCSLPQRKNRNLCVNVFTFVTLRKGKTHGKRTGRLFGWMISFKVCFESISFICLTRGNDSPSCVIRHVVCRSPRSELFQLERSSVPKVASCLMLCLHSKCKIWQAIDNWLFL